MNKKIILSLSMLSCLILAGCANPDNKQDSSSQDKIKYPYVTTDENDFSYRAIDGGLEITGYKGSKSNVIIPDMIKNNPVLSIGEKAFYNKKNIKTVKISDNIEKLKNGAFYNSGISSLTLPKNLTYIGEEAFHGLDTLARLDIPNTIEYIGPQAFEYTSILTVYIPFDRPSSSWAENWFEYGNKAIFNYQNKKVTKDNVDYNLVKRDGNLTISAIANKNANVINILDKMTIDNKEYNVTELGDYSLNGQDVIFLPKSITYIGENNFSEHTAPFILNYEGLEQDFKKISVGRKNPMVIRNNRFNQSVTDFAYKTNNDYEYYLINNSDVYIKKYKATHSDVDFNADFKNQHVVSLLKDSFSSNRNLKKILNAKHLLSIHDRALANSTLIEMPLYPGLKLIGEEAFSSTSINNLVLPEGLNFIGESSFSNTNTKTVSIPGSLKNIADYAFNGSIIENLTLNEGIETIGMNAFDGIKINSLTLPNSLKHLAYCAFKNVVTLENIDFGTGLKEIGPSAFKGCGFKSLFIPSTIEKLEQNCFEKCDSLTKVFLSRGLKEIQERAFYDDRSKVEEVRYEGSEQEFKQIKGYQYITKYLKVLYNQTY